MAIVFSKDISITNWLNAYNNNVIQFNSNSGKTATKCLITIGSSLIEITPNSTGVFKYNLKQLLKVLVNNNFIDSIQPTSLGVGDSSLAKTYTITLLITFSDTTTETINRTINVLKRVEQIDNPSTDLVSVTKVLNDDSLVIWNDLPIDVSVLGTNSFSVIVNNATTIITPTQLATRVYLGNLDSYRRLVNAGYTVERNQCIDDNDTDPIPYGHSTIVVGNKSIKIEKRNECGVQYLKWFNVEKGTYNYWGFNAIYKDSTSVKTKDSFRVDFDDLSLTNNTELISGKTAEKFRSLMADDLIDAQRDLLNSLLTSPKVELYSGSKFQSVLVTDGSFTTSNTKIKTHKLNITIKINHYSY